MSSAPAHPKLREDLVVREQAHADGTIFVIKDPRVGRFFRFGETEAFIARHLDGLTPLETVRKKALEELSCDLSAEDLEQFTRTLRGNGLLEESELGTGSTPSRRRVGGSLLYLRFRAFDPERVLARVAPKAGAFFTPGFLLASALAILAAVGITVFEWGEIRRDLLGLWRFDALLLAWVIVLVVTAIHEFAHGITCKRFGGEVHEMGFMLIYFQPAFYCNVSDAWLFPEKSRRLWVTFSGAYVEILVWALATFVWRLAQPQTWISFAAMVVMATSGIKTLFNLNPLIKLDGYYLLSDWLEIPNLRQRSLGYLRDRMGRIFRGGARSMDEIPRRERRIFVAYGLLAGVYSAWLLGWVASRFGAFLIERYEGLGFLLFGGLVMLMLRNPLKRLWAGGVAAFKSARAWPSLRTWMKLLASGAALAAILFLGRMELTAQGEFTALPLHNADIETEVEGFVEEVAIDEGDRIDQGDMVARLSNPDFLADLEETEAEIEAEQAELKTRLSRARATAEKARSRLEYASRDLDRVEALRREGLISPQQFEQIEGEVAVRHSELEEAEAELGKLGTDPAPARPGSLPAGSRSGILDITRTELARLESRRNRLEEQIRALIIVSPSAGVVTTPRLKLQEMVGRFVERGDLIAEVHELQTIMAVIAVPEKDIGEARPGQRVVVRVRAYPDRSFEGKVVSIAAAADRPEPDGVTPAPLQHEKSFLVTTELDNPDLLLKPGMTGHAKIHCGPRRVIDLVTRSIAGHLRVEFWSWW